MNFRMLLFPFSILYDGITSLRNIAYDKGWLSSTRFKIPVICVGNLSVGGTGKSPMVAYLMEMLQKEYRISVLSRGYKRKTSGFLEVTAQSTAEEVGDEPLQLKQNFPQLTVAVCADRREGISELEKKAQVILLDDAFQHRKVKPSFSILLTSYQELYLDDFLLPAGNLRESRNGAKRADVIIVTKCPEGASYASLQAIQYRMKLKPHQNVFFSKIGYDTKIYGPTESLPFHYLEGKKFTLVTGIANPQPLIEYLHSKELKFKHKKFPDHHAFSASEISELSKEELIITTEKDYMRLQPKLGKFAVYYLPIKTIILNEKGNLLNEIVKDSVENFRPSTN